MVESASGFITFRPVIHSGSILVFSYSFSRNLFQAYGLGIIASFDNISDESGSNSVIQPVMEA